MRVGIGGVLEGGRELGVAFAGCVGLLDDAEVAPAETEAGSAAVDGLFGLEKVVTLHQVEGE